MDIEKLEEVCRQVTKGLTPTRIETLELVNKSFTLRVVSNEFEGMAPLNRFRLLAELFEKRASHLSEEYAFGFEAWTEEEFAELIRDGKVVGPASGWSSGMAAKNI